MSGRSTSDAVLGVREHTFTTTFTYTKIRCGRCGHEFETTGQYTGTCKRCGRACRIWNRAVIEAAGAIPIIRSKGA